MSGYSTRRIVDLEDKVRHQEAELIRLRQLRRDVPEILKRDPELPGRSAPACRRLAGFLISEAAP